MAAADTLSFSLLEHALRSLVNLTHSSTDGASSVLQHGLGALGRVIGAELGGAAEDDERGGLPLHHDVAMMAIGVLTNCLEVTPGAASRVGAVARAPPPAHAREQARRPRG